MNLKTTEHKRRLFEIVLETSVSFAIDDVYIMKMQLECDLKQRGFTTTSEINTKLRHKL